MGERSGTGRARGRRLVISRRYAIAVLLIMLAAVALSAAFATSANALPTFTAAVGGIGPCDSCHTRARTHAVSAHASFITGGQCSLCHVTDTATPPTPAACATCHGGTPTILAAHPARGCATTPGCHGVVVTTPAITSFTPASGAVGSVITLTGTGFPGATGVTFNGVAATTFTVITPTSMTAKVPTGATSGTIAVTTSAGTGTSTDSFTVNPRSKITIKLVGLKAGVLKFGKVVTARGLVTPIHAAKVTITFQRKVGTKWVKVKAFTRTSNATSGAYSVKYKPTRKGSWRVQSKLAKTVSFTAAKTTFKTFKVK